MGVWRLESRLAELEKRRASPTTVDIGQRRRLIVQSAGLFSEEASNMNKAEVSALPAGRQIAWRIRFGLTAAERAKLAGAWGIALAWPQGARR